jgi:hypothetical protein
VSVLARDRFCCVAGQGCEPWKASVDGFTARRHQALIVLAIVQASLESLAAVLHHDAKLRHHTVRERNTIEYGTLRLIQGRL